MKLLVSCIPYDKGKSGISTYVREVVRELAAQEHELSLIVEPSTDQIIESSNHQTIVAPGWTSRAVFSMFWHLFILPFWIRRHRREFDGFVICAANRRVCAFYPLPTTATVHDLANFHIPGKYSRLRMFYLAHVLPFFAKRAQHLVAVSGATKVDMLKYWHCHDEDVTVLYNGLSGCNQRQAESDHPTSDIQHSTSDSQLSTLNSQLLTSSSILYISRIEHPGKNHLRLIEAYGRLPRALAEAHPLVIAGADWKDAEVVHDAAAKSPYSDLIRFTGFVPNEEIEKLWAEAGFYVFPSLFEGFGLSLIEAMARGIPCACSNNGSLGEIADDVAITFDPESVEGIADTLERLLSEDDAERKARIVRGLEHIKRFSWADHVAGIVKLLDARRVEDNAPYQNVKLFGIPIAKVSESDAVERIITIARQRNSNHQTNEQSNHQTIKPSNHQTNSRAAFVATLNVDFVSNAVSGWPFGGNDELWGYLKNADFVTADGMPIVLLSKLKRNPLPARVTGADMVPAICRRCAEEGLSVYVLGGDGEAIEEAFRNIDVPSLRVVGIDPAFVKLDMEQPEIVERINAASPDILFVALGNPKQELWMGRNAAKLNVGAMIGIGGTFNFLAGRVKRAPKWMQKSGLEWIYRIIQEPGRLWRRYAYGLVKFSYLSAGEILRR